MIIFSSISPSISAAKTHIWIVILCTVLTLGTAQVTQAQDFMTQAELLATIPGSQISGISNRDGKTPWVQAYSKANSKNRGLLNGIWNKKDKYQSEWYVKGDQWCEKWDSGEGCWSAERIRKKNLRMYKDGEPLKNTWNLK